MSLDLSLFVFLSKINKNSHYLLHFITYLIQIAGTRMAVSGISVISFIGQLSN